MFINRCGTNVAGGLNTNCPCRPCPCSCHQSYHSHKIGTSTCQSSIQKKSKPARVNINQIQPCVGDQGKVVSISITMDLHVLVNTLIGALHAPSKMLAMSPWMLPKIDLPMSNPLPWGIKVTHWYGGFPPLLRVPAPDLHASYTLPRGSKVTHHYGGFPPLLILILN